MRQVLQALQDNGLVIHAEKCVWGVPELEYLDHKTSTAGVLPLPSHMGAIQEFPHHSIIKELQAFYRTSTGDSFPALPVRCGRSQMSCAAARRGRKGRSGRWQWMLLLHVQSKPCFVQPTWSTLQ